MANDTMIHGGVTYNVWYVDPSGSNGNGETPATSFNVLPAPASIPESACYIIRRNSSAVTMNFANATSTTKYLMIIGMPLPTDELYQEIPTAAKTAWDADDPSVLYANFKLITSDATMYRSNNYQFITDRVHWFRNTGVGCTYNMISFTLACSRWLSNIKINNCKFSQLGYDMSTPGYNTMIPQGNSYCYIWADANSDASGTNTFTVTNCVINCGIPSNSWYTCMAARSVRYVNFSNNTIHMVGTHIYPTAFYFNALQGNTHAYENFESAIYDNNNLTLWINGNQTYSYQFATCLYSGKANYTSFRNWTVTDSPTVLGGSGLRPSQIYFLGPLLKLDDLRSCDVKNISVNITQWSEINDSYQVQTMYCNDFTDANRIYGGGILILSGLPSGSMEGYVRNISDITINLSDTPTVSPNVDQPNWGKFNGHQSYYYSFAAMVVDFAYGEDKVYSSSWGSSNIQYPYTQSSKALVKLTNIVVNNYRGKALGLSGVDAVLGDIKGQVMCTTGTVATINSISTWFPGAALLLSPNYLYAGCIVQVGTLTVNKSNPTYPYTNQLAVAFSTTSGGLGTPYSPRCNMVYVGTSNAPTASNVGDAAPANDNRAYPNRFACICANELAAGNGNYCMRTFNYVVNTWSTYRTGGASASLKIWQNACSQWTDWMFLGQDPYSAMVVTPATTGKKYIRMYLAHKGYGDPTSIYNNVQFIVKYVNSTGNGSKDYRYSMNDGVWKTDAVSTWNGDTGLTQLVCQIPVNIQTMDPIDVKMGFNWYSASGYLYLDPIPVIADTLL